jgi:hypothetical protein
LYMTTCEEKVRDVPFPNMLYIQHVKDAEMHGARLKNRRKSY